MQLHADQKRKTTKRSSVGTTLQRKVQRKSVKSLQDNRPQAIIQRKLQAQLQQQSEVHQMQPISNTTASGAVIQRNEWTKAKVKRFKAWLRRRAARRYAKGKRKPSFVLVRKYIRARQMANKKWKPSMADSHVSGHHVPPLALSNKHKGKFVFGKRGSTKEKKRRRLYFKGKSKRRKEAHWMAHEAEAMQGINRMTNFQGTDNELATKMILAHHGLQTSDGHDIEVEDRAQNDAPTGKVSKIWKATKSIMKSKVGKLKIDIDTDDDTSEPESNFSELDSDSDNHYQSDNSDDSDDDSSDDSD
jgi:hypothetical protein